MNIETLSALLLIAALAVFIVAIFPLPSRINLVALGLALLTASMLAGHFIGLH